MILPGMRADVRLGTNLKGCTPTSGLLNQVWWGLNTIYIYMRKYSRPQVSSVHSLIATARVSVPSARCSWLKTCNAPSLKEKGVRQLRIGYREINKETVQNDNGYKHRSWTPAHSQVISRTLSTGRTVVPR